MTISSQIPVKNHKGNNSTTQFDFDFYIENEDQLLVTHTDLSGNVTYPEYGVDYTINAIGQETGSYITFPIQGSDYDVLAWDTSSGEKEILSISLNLPIEQPATYNTSGNLNKKNLEYSFDFLTRLVQILDRKVQRAVKVGEGTDINTDQLVYNINMAIKHLSNIDTVASDRENIDAVADNKTNIDTVAGSIVNVNKVGNDISNVNTVAGDTTNVDTVAGSISNVNIVAGDITNVNTVANDKTNVDTVAGNTTNINKVAGDINRVNLVADDISSVHTVAIDISNVIDVAANKTNIDTVAGDKSNIDIVAGDKANIDIVAGDKNNIDAVAGSISNVDTVAGNIADVNTVADISSNVVDVAANEDNITTVAVNINDVQNAANLIETVYSVLNGGTASSTYTEGISGGDASSTFTTRIVGGSGSSVGTIVGDIQSNIRVIELHQRIDEANIADLRTDLTTETTERIAADAGLQSQIDDISDEIILINQNAGALDERILENTGDITEAFNQIHSNDDDILAMQLVDEGQSEDILSLQSEVGILQSEAKEVYSVLRGGAASTTFTDGISGGAANTTFTKRVTGGTANSLGCLLADAHNFIKTLFVKLANAFEEISILKNNISVLSNEIDAINSITRISGGTATSVFE